MALFTVENSLTFEKVPREEKKRMEKKGFTRVGNPMTTVFSPSLLGKDTFQYGNMLLYVRSITVEGCIIAIAVVGLNTGLGLV